MATIEQELSGAGVISGTEVDNLEQDITPEPEGRSIIDILKTQTGEGEVEDYLNHSLNFNNSKYMARILRGMTGFLGGLNFAIADILVGLMEYGKTKKMEVKADV